METVISLHRIVHINITNGPAAFVTAADAQELKPELVFTKRLRVCEGTFTPQSLQSIIIVIALLLQSLASSKKQTNKVNSHKTALVVGGQLLSTLIDLSYRVQTTESTYQ